MEKLEQLKKFIIERFREKERTPTRLLQKERKQKRKSAKKGELKKGQRSIQSAQKGPGLEKRVMERRPNPCDKAGWTLRSILFTSIFTRVLARGLASMKPALRR